MTISHSHKIDALNRVLLPKELLRKLGWKRGDTLSLCYDEAAGETLSLHLLAKYTKPKCFHCERTDIEITINRKAVCAGCLEKALERL
ncbi:MAG: AbrB/MazE/SpoVT family DNA-binding domain-containing protein [Defluviitaleaceae bacterium]|nr:AbrB/MazE/SpoVT family DNA-binding domain-containing protein [Defluviitaleaceae bacterium]